MQVFWLIWIFSMICALSVIPLQYPKLKQQTELFRMAFPGRKIMSAKVMMVITLVQLYVFLGISTFVGLRIIPDTQLDVQLLDVWHTGTSIPTSMTVAWGMSALLGVVMGLLLECVDQLYYQPRLPRKRNTEEPKSTDGLWASLYGGVCEEILMRLGVMSVIVWVAGLAGLGMFAYWLGIILSALVFGAAHLPILFQDYGNSPIVIQRGLVLNGMAGAMFGWLYWEYGLEAAIISHISTDLIYHVVIRKIMRKQVHT
ncbi:CPBP family intramembrane glutamic endopeptidase [Brevibacillus dissolubilis]|uniref:CPBP family intramembrane glutamic endopeptidase n=1 Tax=Brevibacillus dissolubilis TaxID=1844116 RepID=UPI001116000F|nr:CPBP family intramembrane glutamic endopeptidase [Brevibacillus dissolubilis]